MEDAERSPSSSEPEPSNSESGGSDGGEEPGSDSDAEASSGSKRSADSSRQPGGGARGGKHPLPAPVAVGRRPAGSPSSSGDGKPARKRLNLFPKIKASERCGQCENCLNPQRKKACIEARRRQEERMAKEKAGARGSSGGGSTAAAKSPPQQPAAVAAAAAAAADPWGRELQRVLGPSGGVIRPEHALPLVKLLQSARTLNQRVALLAVLGRSTPDVLAAAVRHRALLALQAWLTDFVAAGKPGPASKLLGCLAKLPVTLESLQAPCELGRMVGKLRKDESMDAAVRNQAKALVAQWKRVVEGGGSSRLLRGVGAWARGGGVCVHAGVDMWGGGGCACGGWMEKGWRPPQLACAGRQVSGRCRKGSHCTNQCGCNGGQDPLLSYCKSIRTACC